ncbi:hypothetical protein SESBI_14936 [Sesbania bispinosa]|nr:hypothetical protein SESBI_14936 [Sesbania bispinosa]
MAMESHPSTPTSPDLRKKRHPLANGKGTSSVEIENRGEKGHFSVGDEARYEENGRRKGSSNGTRYVLERLRESD